MIEKLMQCGLQYVDNEDRYFRSFFFLESIAESGHIFKVNHKVLRSEFLKRMRILFSSNQSKYSQLVINYQGLLLEVSNK